MKPSLSGESCPDKSQVGTVTMRSALHGGTARTFGLFNLTPPPGVAAMLGTAPFGEPIAFAGQVRNTAGEYGLDLEAQNFPQGLAIDGVTVTIWGTPWAVSHDAERGNCLKRPNPASPGPNARSGRRKTTAPRPSSPCPPPAPAPLHYAVSADSWQQPGTWVGDSAISRDAEGNPQALTRCDRVNFATTSFSQPTTVRASSATGFDFNLSVNQEGLLEPEGLAGSQIRKAVVALPEGFTINPSVGAGLGVCTPAQFAAETADLSPGRRPAPTIQHRQLHGQSPLVVEPTTSFEQIIKGSIYLAQPDNKATTPRCREPLRHPDRHLPRRPGPQTGSSSRSPASSSPTRQTGQLVAIFEGLPQLPYTNLKIHFREGQRAPLATPAACGTYTTDVELTPWLSSTAQRPDTRTSSSRSPTGVGGGPCPLAARRPSPPAPKTARSTPTPAPTRPSTCT